MPNELPPVAAAYQLVVESAEGQVGDTPIVSAAGVHDELPTAVKVCPNISTNKLVEFADEQFPFVKTAR